MAKNENASCPMTGGCDRLSCLLSKVGVTRSLLITLALLPFAWKGVNLCASGVSGLWHMVVDAAQTAAK